MRKVSSSADTAYYKRIFPTIWFGFLSVAVIGGLFITLLNQGSIFMLLIPIGMIVFGYVLFRTLVFDLMDEAFLGENEFVVRKNGDEIRIPFPNILNISASAMVNPERITLTLRDACKFGHEVSFLPPFRILRFSRHPLAEELTQIVRATNQNATTL